MDLRESLRLSWRSIVGHKLRSGLTMLGVVIGVAAVIAFVTLGASLQAGVIGEVSPDDQRNLYGWAADPDVEAGPGAGAQPVFSDHDLETVSELEAVDSAYGYAPLQTQGVTFEDEQVAMGDGIVSAGPSYIREETIREGRQFESGEREAVLNPAAAGQFETDVAVGDDLTITLLGGQQTTVEVVGITDTSEGLSPFEGFESTPRMYVPTDPYYVEQLAGLGGGPGDGAGDDGGNGDAPEGDDGGADGDSPEDDEGGADGDGPEDDDDDAPATGTDGAWFTAIIVEAPSTDEAAIEDARRETTAYLESDESDAGQFLGDDLEVSLETSTELLAQLQELLDLLQNFIVGVAAISLLVGSIGIANIMLVSVTERTREIGIMKAVGAQNRDVLGLFLAEAVILGVIGAILGTALGLVAGYLGAWYIDLPLIYPFEYVVLAVVVGILVGVISGLYPAWRAARTDPIDALRYE